MVALSSRLRRVTPFEAGFFVQLPLIVVGVLLWAGRGLPGWDFAVFRRAAIAVLHNQTPYVKPTFAALSQQDHFVYPQPFAYLFAPFVFLPVRVGALLFFLASLAALMLSLRLLSVRDWRLYTFSLLSAPVLYAIGLGTVNMLLLLLVAAGWRLRNSVWAGVLLALAAAMKLFLWPLLVWLVVTRRLRTSAAAAATLLLLVGIWADLDWGGLRRYPETLRLLERVDPTSLSPRTLWLSLGFPEAGLIPVAAAVIGIGFLLALRRGERECFAAALIVALCASPIVWIHYFVVLLVPLALLVPRLSWPWLLLLGFWVTRVPALEQVGQNAAALVLLAAISAATLRLSATEWTPITAHVVWTATPIKTRFDQSLR